MPAALSGIRVLDLSRLLPGPYCSMLLADMGADVIKIEAPVTGDYIRLWPPLLGGASGYHAVLNRNKRSLTLNLKVPEGKEILERLARDADVLLEGFRPGVMDRLGLGHASFEKINPRLVYCAITGYGSGGPLASRAGHDINYQALSGVLSYSGYGKRPALPGVQIADLGGGALLAAFSIMTALFARERLGKGQFLDISMTDGAMAWNCLQWGAYLADGRAPGPGEGFLNHGCACYNVYETRDGRYMALGAMEPQFWKAFCRTAGHPEWDRPDHLEPGPHQVELQERIGAFFRQKTQKEWIERFGKADCCCEPVLDLPEAMDSPLARERGMAVEEKDGVHRQLGIAPKFSLTPGELRSRAPALGEHTASILGELGYSPAQIGEFRAAGVV